MLGLTMPVEAIGLGAITGLGYGMLAAGLVLTFRTSRVINLAHGQTGAFSAVVLAVTVQRWGLAYWLALPLALAVGMGLGALVDVAVVRRLRAAPAAMTLIATLGVAQVLLFATLAVSASLPPGALFPQPPGLPTAHLGTLLVSQSSFALLILSPLLAAGVAIVLRHTALGAAVRAAASNPQAARVLGIRAPRLTTLVWAVAGAFAALTAVFVLPAGGTAGAEALGPTLLLRALAAAVLAGLASMPRALAAGVVIGVVESVVQFNAPRGDATDALVFAALVIAFVARRVRLPEGRESWVAVSRWPRLPEGVRAAPAVRRAGLGAATTALAAAVALPLLADPADEVRLVGVACVALTGLSVWLVTGLGGQLALGQFAVAGVGALVVVRLPAGPAPAIAAAVVVCSALGAALGMVGVRAGRLGYAVLSLGFALAASGWLFAQPWAFADGRAAAKLDLGVVSAHTPAGAYLLCLVALVACLGGVRRFARGPWGRRLVALRDHEQAARLAGVRPFAPRALAFAAAGGIAGLAGALLAQGLFEVGADAFDPVQSLRAVAIVAVGGLASPVGAVLGALYVVALPVFVDLSSVAAAATALGWTLLIVQFPGGLAQIVMPLRDAIARRLAGTNAPAPARTLAPLAAAAPPAPPPARLALEGVGKRYGPTVALGGVDLDIEPGEWVAVVGPNGAGKTTLLDVTSGLVRPDEGRVRLGGTDITALLPERRAALGMRRSLQRATLFPTLTVVETVALAMEARGGGSALARAAGIVELFGLGEHAHAELRTLSTGMRSVTQLAALLSTQPRVVLLDEPSAGLAAREREMLVELLAAIRLRLRPTLVLVEHDMAVVGGVADRVIVLEGGRVATGSPAAPPREVVSL